jgi:hypothetical protein
MNKMKQPVLRSTAIFGARFGRRQRTSGIFLVLILVLIKASSSFPQSQRAPNPKAAVTSAVPAQNLDFSGGRLPSNFVPIPAAELYEAAGRTLVAPEKSEFETTAQYQARIEALAQKILLRGLKASDDFAFVLRPSSHSISGPLQKRDDFLMFQAGVETKYDADSKQMSVSIPTDAGEFGGDYKWVSAIHRSVAYGVPYVGQTAFGVKHLIRRVKTDTLELEMEDYDWLSPDYTGDGTEKVFSLTVEPDQARTLSDDIEIIVIGKLRAPFTSHSVDGTEPSLEQAEPTNIARVHRLLHITLDRVIIADSRTGAILKQFSRKKHQTEFPLTVEFRGEDVPFSDSRCTESAYLFPFNILSIDYSVDGGAEQHEFLQDPTRNGPLRIEAHSYVDVSIKYCDIPRVRVLVGGSPYKLSCEYQGQYIANDSKCARIQTESAQPSSSETQ